jgi:hypothetical protein
MVRLIDLNVTVASLLMLFAVAGRADAQTIRTISITSALGSTSDCDARGAGPLPFLLAGLMTLPYG